VRRQLALADFALGSLRRRGGKHAALVVALALVVGLFSSTLFLTGALRAEYEALVDRMPDLTVQRQVAGRPALIDPALAETIRALPAVREVRERVWGYAFFLALEGNVTILGVDTEPRHDLAVEEGRLPRAAGEVAIGTALARSLGLRVGDELGLPARGDILFSDVVGVFGTASALRSADLIVATPAHARVLLGVPEDRVTDLAVDLTTADEAPVIAARVDALAPGTRVLDRRLLGRTYELTFDTRSGLTSALLVPALAAFLLLAWERLTGLGAAERREIGVLKAIGWSTGDVLAVRLWESFLLAVAGTTLGLLLAYTYVFWLGAPGLIDALLGWSNLYPPFTPTPAVDVTQLLTLFGGVAVPFIAVSVVPAWRAATHDPMGGGAR
jgi:lipoprotein-releasing system permease protein